MVDGRDDHMAQGAPVPIDIGVSEEREDAQERPGRRRGDGVEPEQDEREHQQGVGEHVVDGVGADAAEPVELLGTMVHGVEAPERAAVEPAVDPVEQEIAQQEGQGELRPARELRDRPEAAVLVGLQRLERDDPRRHEDHHAEDDDHDEVQRIGQEGVDHPAEEVGPDLRTPPGATAFVAEDVLDQPE